MCAVPAILARLLRQPAWVLAEKRQVTCPRTASQAQPILLRFGAATRPTARDHGTPQRGFPSKQIRVRHGETHCPGATPLISAFVPPCPRGASPRTGRRPRGHGGSGAAIKLKRPGRSRQGRGLLPAPRTDPYVRLSRIRLPPWVQTLHRGGDGAHAGTCR
jgi:hypothetical protein